MSSLPTYQNHVVTPLVLPKIKVPAEPVYIRTDRTEQVGAPFSKTLRLVRRHFLWVSA
jgi:hypothetical protein